MFQGHESLVQAVAFSHDGQSLVSSITTLLYLFCHKTGFSPFKAILKLYFTILKTKNLDSSYKMDLDFYKYFGRKTNPSYSQLSLLHSERPKLYTILDFLSAIGLTYLGLF